MKRLVLVSGVLLAAGLFGNSVAGAEPCKLLMAADLKLTEAADGSLVLPVTLAGNSQPLAVEISTPLSYLNAAFVDQSGFEVKALPWGVNPHVGTRKATGMVTVPGFGMGNIQSKQIQFLRMEGADGSGRVGLLGMDILSNFDIEIDFANSELKLFQHEDCSGKVVYWANNYAEVRYRTDVLSHPMFNMDLDGHEVIASLTTLPGSGHMGMLEAHRLFGIDEHSPGVMPDLNAKPGEAKSYRYPFKKLSVDGVAINNPDILLEPDRPECRPEYSGEPSSRPIRCYGGEDLLVGLSEMRHLHIYLATRDKTLYLTAADASRGEPKQILPR